MGTTNLDCVNARSISVNGTLLAGSPAHAAEPTRLDSLATASVLALSGVPVAGIPPAGSLYTNYDALAVTQATVNGVSVP